MKSFSRFLPLLAIGAMLFFVVPTAVSAAPVSCDKYGGSCKSACGDDEFASDSLYQNWRNTSQDYVNLTNKALQLEPGDAIDCGGTGVCCIPKGEQACSIIGFAYKPPPDGMAWGCQPSCSDGSLNPSATDKSREYCPGTTVCCKYKVRVGTTTSFTVVKGSDTKVTNPLGSVTTITGVINRVIKVFLGLVGALAFAVFVYSGVLWMTAGSSGCVQTAKDAMKYAVIGLILIGLSFAITNFIIDAFVAGAPGTSAPTPAPVQEAAPISN